MKLISSYKININRILLLVVCSAFISSCAPTRRLAEDEKLFVSSTIKTDKKEVDVQTIKKYERITPNKKVLGIRFHLYLHSLANPDKETGISGWLKKIGEPPVLFDSILVAQSADNITSYLSNRGYENASCSAKVKQKKKKAKVKYNIKAGEPVRIHLLKYILEDTSLARFIYADTINALFHEGDIFDKVKFQAERERIEEYLKNRGYYRFTKEFIYYEVRPTENANLVDVTIHIKQNINGPYNPVSRIRPHIRYKINSVLVTPNIKNSQNRKMLDTLDFMDHRFLYFEKLQINPKILVGANSLLPSSIYRLDNVDRTYLDYSSLGLYRYINISFAELPIEDGIGQLECNIDLSMRKRQSYAVELTLTNTQYDLGIKGGVTYNNYNLFHGGEHFLVGVSGGIESLENRLGNDTIPYVEPMKEFGVIARLETPKFLLPFNAVEFQRKYKPRTEFKLSFNYQKQPKYIRTIVNTSFGYNWRGNAVNRHAFYPVDFYLVKLPWIDTAYINKNYKDTRLENSFVNHTILGLRYNFEFNNRQTKIGNSFVYLIYNFESAGFLVNKLNKLTEKGTDSLLFGVLYYQYLKNDVDFRHYYIITPHNRIVYRIFAGVGLPYGNSKSVPFEKMYWSGGPYGIRAWGERTLGPGPTSTDSTYNQLGEIKLEANLEYRFKLFWKMEGGLFVDAGNIWMFKDDEKPSGPDGETTIIKGSGFHFNQFYRDIAVGVGVGARFDFSFVLVRLDFGFKLHDPSIKEGSKWVINNPNRNFWQATFQFGIGYPF